jgi:hypothetical protein
LPECDVIQRRSFMAMRKNGEPERTVKGIVAMRGAPADSLCVE